MLNPGRKETDKRLHEIEKHLHEIYSQAYDELSKKTNDYFSKFKEEDAVKRSLVKAGKMKQADYKKWRKSKMQMGKHWEAMKEQAAKDLHNVNKTATLYMNDQLPDIYAMNYNISAKDIESGVSKKISFEMTNPKTVRDLSMSGDKSFLPYKELDPVKDIPWNMRKINNAMLQGILQGDSIDQIAKRFMDVGVDNEVSAIRAARTMVTTVENKARLDTAIKASEMGVKLGKIWLSISDHRTREWHVQAALDYSTPIPLDEPFVVNGEKMSAPGDTSASPNNVYNCRCSLGRLVLGFESILPEDKRGKIKVSFK